jgi:hypothetical protein
MSFNEPLQGKLAQWHVLWILLDEHKSFKQQNLKQ